MDFKKVLDQTVREIKREVNLKVLKVPEIEQKVLDASSDEPWGPHGSDLADIARATKRYGECAMVMSVLWQRLGNTGANWRHVYKALAVIEYLLANGTERVVDEIIDNSSQIAKLTSFEYVEPNGKDVGLNVRKKAENVLGTVDDREKLQQIREKAAATRDKYFGLSSTGVTYNSSTASFGSGSYSSGSHYVSTQSSKEADISSNSYRGKERSNRSKNAISNFRTSRQMSRENRSSATNSKPTKGEGCHRRNQDSPTSQLKSSSNIHSTSGGKSSQKADTDDDDFNPRVSSTSGTANVSSNHVDLFGPSLMDDHVDTTAFTSRALPRVGTASVPEVDLFANADFHSANAPATGSHAQEIIDLFAGTSSFANSISPDIEFSGCKSPNKSSEHNPSPIVHSSASVFDPFQPSFATSFPSDTEFSAHETPAKSKNPTHQHSVAADFDPFAAIAMRNLDGSNSFDASSSNTGSDPNEPRHDPPVSVRSSDHSHFEELNFGSFTSHTEPPKASAIKSLDKLPTKPEPASTPAAKPDVKKGAFRVKSGIWADSLSRGLINLNITAPKKAHLSDVIGGQLNNGSKESASAAPSYMGATMHNGSGLGSSAFTLPTGTNCVGGAEISGRSSLETSSDCSSRYYALP